MFIIIKPMLAPNKATTKEDLDFSGDNYYLATPKIDGIRVLKVDGHLVTRSFNEVKNDFIQNTLSPMLPDGCDGEIVVGNPSDDNFQETSGSVRRSTGEPDFTFCMFDYVKDANCIDKPYRERVKDMFHLHVALCDLGYGDRIKILVPVVLDTFEKLEAYNTKCLEEGYEGIMLRTPEGRYKCGRGTVKEQLLLKWKKFEDAEAVITGFIEKMHNNNPAEKDNFGRTKRSVHKENLVGAKTLGALRVKSIDTGLTFDIGSGFNAKQRKDIWENRDDWEGTIIKYKHFAVTGVKDKPRFPVYLGVRDEDDM